MARCPDCNKFVSVELADPECDADLDTPFTEYIITCKGCGNELRHQLKPDHLEPCDACGSEEFSDFICEDDITLHVNVKLVLQCAECGGDLLEAECEDEQTFTLRHVTDCKSSLGLEHECDATPRDRYDGVGRYAKHYWGVGVEAAVSCPACKVSERKSFIVEEQASAFSEV